MEHQYFQVKPATVSTAMTDLVSNLMGLSPDPLNLYDMPPAAPLQRRKQVIAAGDEWGKDVWLYRYPGRRWYRHLLWTAG